MTDAEKGFFEPVKNGELLLELLSEEIPARMQRRALDELIALLRGKFAEAEIPAQSWRGFVTPRRLAVIAEGIPARQPDRREERRGPRVGSPPRALDGFLRGTGLASIEQCETRDTGRGEFYFAVIDRPGAPAAEALPGLIRAAIGELPWPKSMRYPASSLRWMRPLQSAICLLDGEVLPLPLDGIPVGRTTRGHRFLSSGEIAVENAADYQARLGKAHVVLDLDRRKEIIETGVAQLAGAEGLTVKSDPGLLEEVAGLVEYPVPLVGTIDDDCMALPPEVLATAMRAHQKYFTALKPDGEPAPRFLFVANNLTPDDGRTIVAGNERVLRARLADARFFWDQDRRTPLEDRIEALKQRVYHEKLGSVYDKVERIEKVSAFLAEMLVAPAKAGAQGHASEPAALGSRLRGNDEGELAKLAQRAAHLAKADLSTGMVGEFPELQGVMGRYYALHGGEDPQVAAAIADHYKPLGPNDWCPTAPVSIVVALADKLDSLAAFFSVGEEPTGSRDPFALRRAALGVIRIILENGIRIPLLKPLGMVATALGSPDAGTGNAMEFITDRLEVHLRSDGVRYDVLKAAFLPTGEKGIEDDIVRLLRRVDALTKFVGTESGADLLVAFRRASNIVNIEVRKGGWTEGGVRSDLLTQNEERVLSARLNDAGGRVGEMLELENFELAMTELATLRQPIDEFFEQVTVNASEPALRQNRLRLLLRIRAVMNQIADFSQIDRLPTNLGTMNQ